MNQRQCWRIRRLVPAVGVIWVAAYIVLAFSDRAVRNSFADELCQEREVFFLPVVDPPYENVPADRRHVVILSSLPGDNEHAQMFSTVMSAWKTWLTDALEIPENNIHLLPEMSVDAAESQPAPTASDVRALFQQLREQLAIDNSLWVITLGHGSFDGKRAWFHLAGKDPSEIDVAGWLADCPCREQVVFLTHSTAGRMVKALSRPGRIVIAATADDDETNETEFPHAFQRVTEAQPSSIDRNENGELTLLEFYFAIVDEVERGFKADNRLATEHAQLDDDGVNRGELKGPKRLQQPDSLPEAKQIETPNDGSSKAAVATTPSDSAEADPEPPVPPDLAKRRAVPMLSSRIVLADRRLAKKPSADGIPVP